MLSEINPQNELNFILQYVAQTWEGGDSSKVEKSIRNLYNDALDITRNTLDLYAFNDFLSQLGKKVNIQNINVEIFDDNKPLNWLLLNLNYGYMDLVSFEKDNRTYNPEDFEQLEPIFPKYWEPLNTNYRTRNDIVAYMIDKPKVPFLGTHFKYETSFEQNVGMEHVMYYAHEQSCKPEVSLAYAIAQQARLVNKNNNAVRMLKEWQVLLDIEKDFKLNFQEPLNVALQHFIHPEKSHLNVHQILESNKFKKTKKLKLT